MYSYIQFHEAQKRRNVLVRERFDEDHGEVTKSDMAVIEGNCMYIWEVERAEGRDALQRHNTENSKQIFPGKELRVYSPNSGRTWEYIDRSPNK
jgi:hypothetical protein